MQKIVHVITFLLLVTSLIGGQSFIVINQVHAHEVSAHHSHDESFERTMDHSDFEHDDRVVTDSSNTEKANPVHSHTFIKVPSLKLIGKSYFTPRYPLQVFQHRVCFSFFDLSFKDIYLPGNIRPPIFA